MMQHASVLVVIKMPGAGCIPCCANPACHGFPAHTHQQHGIVLASRCMMPLQLRH